MMTLLLLSYYVILSFKKLVMSFVYISTCILFLFNDIPSIFFLNYRRVWVCVCVLSAVLVWCRFEGWDDDDESGVVAEPEIAPSVDNNTNRDYDICEMFKPSLIEIDKYQYSPKKCV